MIATRDCRKATTRGLVPTCVAVLAISLGSVAGCSRGKDPSAEAATATPTAPGYEFDGCDLVRRTDAERVLRERVERGTAVNTLAAASCTWEASAGRGAQRFELSIYRGTAFYAADEAKDDSGFESVDGVSDGAFFVEPMGLQMRVLVGDFTVILHVVSPDAPLPAPKPELKPELVRLAERIASKLG